MANFSDSTSVVSGSSTRKLARSMGLFSGTMNIVGTIVGSGIFSLPALVFAHVGSPGMSILLWIIGGLVSFSGVLGYNEFGCMFPYNGGEKEYLERSFKKPKKLFSFLFCMCLIIFIRSSFCAAISTNIGNYVLYAIYGPRDTITDPFIAKHFDWIGRGIAAAALIIITVTQIVSTKWTLRIQDTLSVFKIALLALVVITGFVVLGGGSSAKPVLKASTLFEGTSKDPTDYTWALFKVLAAYDGWNNLNYSIEELKNPIEILPKATTIGLAIVVVLYVLSNLAFFSALPLQKILASQQVVSAEFFAMVYGVSFGQRVLPIFIALSAYGSVSCMAFGASRVILESAREGFLPFKSYLGSVSRLNTPAWALLLNLIISLILMLAPPPGEAYNFLIDMTGYPAWIFYGLSMIGLIYLRKKEPQLPRPFRTSIIFCLLFVLVSFFLMVFPFLPPANYSGTIPYYMSPLLSVVFILLCIPLWWYRVGRHPSEEPERHRVIEHYDTKLGQP
ncbi:amino acid transporter [Basidiobolus meristosporus CBS 931.73]|uniref:Amino acid transporter n=1 Tax=Basidiobolus meristosporus CBS 931.73 TaxID=1314790 RepID=A0A1Y1Z2U0_9FUNG|nr:amino acid transporter [Basidiobolus meristosporus CBS 931.73]|eukprot:ORY04155.1 amino acid transporter [Basidiobolus meristosporus CBS 931.73]